MPGLHGGGLGRSSAYRQSPAFRYPAASAAPAPANVTRLRSTMWAVERRRDQRTIPAKPAERDLIGFDGERFGRPVMFAKVADVAGLG